MVAWRRWSAYLCFCILAAMAPMAAETGFAQQPEASDPGAEAVPDEEKFTLESPKLKAGRPISPNYTIDGKNVSPPLTWKNAPEGTKGFALICDDPDAPTPQPWVHWVIYNIPAEATELPEGIKLGDEVKEPEALAGAIQGRSNFPARMGLGYLGPAPPPGKVHHYHFKLYAIGSDLELKKGLNKKELLEVLDGHIAGEAEIVVTYKR